MDEWKPVGIVVGNDPIDIGDGVNPWDHKWLDVEAPPVELPHPAYPHQRHKMWIYEIESNGRRLRFATGELSNNVWGFYLPVNGASS